MRFFFIIGTGCSATTWLWRLLRGIPKTQINHECRFLADLGEIVKAYHSEQEASRYIEQSRKPWIMGQLREDTKIYGEINGMLRWHCKALMRSFPNATFLQLVRDGRDYVRSMMARPIRFSPDSEMEDMATKGIYPKEGDKYREIWGEMSRFEKICWDWARTNEYIRLNLGKGIVHMERMLEDFGYFKDRILDPLGLEISKGLWAEQIKIQGKPDRRVVMPHHSEWDRETLSKFNEICGDEMVACGYGE